MIRYTRPPVPTGFPTEKIREEMNTQQRTAGRADAADKWGAYKVHFSRAQHQKCGWCESANTTEPGAVDHWAPKGAVEELETAGGERAHYITNLSGRTYRKIHDTGYWWLCYDWSNWLFSCERCNSVWKKALFPVIERPHPLPTPTTPYTPLLLNPFGDEDPLDHLDIDSVGQIRARNRSAKGHATIEALGLDRESLRRQRERIVRSAQSLCDRVELYCDQPTHLRHALEDLRHLGDDDAPFAAAVRCTIRRRLHLEWSEFT